MTERATHLKLAVDVGSDPISGSLAQESGDPRAFCGWIELVAAIEAARYDGGLLDAHAVAPQLDKTLG